MDQFEDGTAPDSQTRRGRLHVAGIVELASQRVDGLQGPLGPPGQQHEQLVGGGRQ